MGRLGVAGVLASVAAIAAACLAFSGVAQAAAPTVTKKFGYTGTEQKFKVRAGVTSVEVKAVGGKGASGARTPGAGGLGAVVTGKLSVTPREVLYVEVGGTPTEVEGCAEEFGGGVQCVGGFNGGGSSSYGGGGGASDVREMSIGTEPSPGNEASLKSRLLVAAGGGGGGNEDHGL
jgi:hypothetical protein